MDEARTVLERLARIEMLDRAGVGRAELLFELRALVVEAEAWSHVEGGDVAERAVDGLRAALEVAQDRNSPQRASVTPMLLEVGASGAQRSSLTANL
jgi:hypothetical protein